MEDKTLATFEVKAKFTSGLSTGSPRSQNLIGPNLSQYYYLPKQASTER